MVAGSLVGLFIVLVGAVSVFGGDSQPDETGKTATETEIGSAVTAATTETPETLPAPPVTSPLPTSPPTTQASAYTMNDWALDSASGIAGIEVAFTDMTEAGNNYDFDAMGEACADLEENVSDLMDERAAPDAEVERVWASALSNFEDSAISCQFGVLTGDSASFAESSVSLGEGTADLEELGVLLAEYGY